MTNVSVVTSGPISSVLAGIVNTLEASRMGLHEFERVPSAILLRAAILTNASGRTRLAITVVGVATTSISAATARNGTGA